MMVIDLKKTFKILVCIAVIGFSLILLWTTAERLIYPKKYSDLVEKYAAEYQVNETLVYAIIKTESSFDSNAVSNVGAIGLMQIMPETFEWLQTKMPVNEELSSDLLYDPEINIKYGVFFLSLLEKEFGDVELVIAAYHAGRGQVNNWLDNSVISPDGMTIDEIPSKSTSHYVSKVIKNINRYNKIYDER